MADIATRRERVVLELEDNFTTGMARAAASASLLKKELNSLSGQSVNSRSISNVSRDMDTVGRSADRSGPAIDRFSGRLTLLRDVALTIGPAFIPIGAVAVPALTGLAAQMGAAAIAGGAIIAAFQGMGGALEAVNKAALEPTAANLQEARLAMETLSPAAQNLVKQLQEFRPALTDLRDAAGNGLFPGVSEALSDLEGALPGVERLLFSVGDAAGTLAEEFAEGISGARGQEFINFLGAEVPGALTDLGRTLGNLTGGLAELWMAFTPLNNDFSDWMLEASRSFDTWAQGLSQTQGFNDFIDYIRTAGPQVADAMGAIGNAVLQIVQAAAPLGGPALAALEGIADVLAAIAGSPAGPALFSLAAGLVLVNRAMQVTAAIKAAPVFAALAGDAAAAGKSMSGLKAAGLGASIGIGAAVVAGNKLVDLFREDLPGVEQLTGMLADLSGGQIGSLPDEFDSLAESIERITDPSLLKGQVTSDTVLGFLGQEGRTLTNAKDEIDALDAALSNLVATGGTEAGTEAFDALVRDAGLSADEIEKLKGLLPGYADALAGAANQERFAADGAEAMASSFNTAKLRAQELKSAITELSAALDQRASLRDYEAALDDFRSTLKGVGDASKLLNKNGSINIDLPKGREIEAALDGIASAAINVADTLPPLQAARVLTQARQDVIAAARAMDMPKAAIRDLLRELGLLDRTKANPKVTADTRAALSGIGVVDNQLGALDKKVADPKVTVDISQVQAGINAVTGLLNSIADEDVYINYKARGRVPGGIQEYDTGGFTGWGGRLEPRGIVHAGEVVIPQWLVKRDWNLLKQRYGHLPGFASGGLVSAGMQQRQAAPIVNVGPSSFSGSVAISDGDVQRIANAVRNSVSAGIAGQSQAADRNVRNMMRGGR